MADRAEGPSGKGSAAEPVPAAVRSASRFAGAVDFVEAKAGLRGWALDVTAPGEAVALEARAAGRLLGRTLCLLDRPDIDAPAGRPTHCGFLLGWSRLDRAALDAVVGAVPDVAVTVEIAATGQPLPWACPSLSALELLALVEAAPRGDRCAAFEELNAALDIAAAGVFDEGFYLAREGAAFAATTPPLLDYLRRGEAAGAWPQAGFDPAAHARAQGLPGPRGALAHALARGLVGAPPPGRAGPPAAAERRAAERAAAREARLPGAPGAEARLALHALRRAAGDLPGAAAAARAALAQLDALPEPARAPALAALAGTAQALHEAGEADAALALARALRDAGAAEETVLLRLLEAELAARDLVAAAPLAERLESGKAGPLSVWSRVALSRFHEAAGRPARARALLEALPRHPETGDAAEAAVLHRLIELGALDLAEARLAAAASAAPAALAGPRLRLAARRMDLAALQALLAGPEAAALADWQLAEAMFRLTAEGRIDQAEMQGVLVQLHRLMCARGLGERSLVMARIHYLQQSRRWEELGRLFAEIEATPLATDRETLRRRLEYHSYADQPEAAERIRRAHFEGVPLDKWEGIAVLRLFGHMGRWAEAGRVLLDHLAAGHGFGAAVPMALGVVRRAQLHAAVLALPPPAGPAGEVAAFRELVARDRALMEWAEAGGEARRRAADWLLPAPAPPAPEDAARAVFLCANQRYFLSLLTFLCSFLGQAPQSRARLVVFLDADVPEGWPAAIGTVGARFGRAIEVVPEAAFVPPGVRHRESLGFFAAGRDLARTAYFRLYAARHLIARGGLARAAYLDTDMICRGDLSGLFALDLGEALIAAAVEDISPEVMHAAGRNRIDPWQYVNSGALLLRMDDARLAPLIEEAIRVAEQEPERLAFHDQCALNIAFQGRIAPLPPRYNFFLRPSRARNGHIEEALLLHFLDQPKPWDIAFDRPYREEWRVWALFLATLLPEAQFLAMLAAANRA